VGFLIIKIKNSCQENSLGLLAHLSKLDKLNKLNKLEKLDCLDYSPNSCYGHSWMKIAALLPHLEVFGGVRRDLKIGNELQRRGSSRKIIAPARGRKVAPQHRPGRVREEAGRYLVFTDG